MKERVLHKSVAVLQVEDPHVIQEIRAVLDLDEYVMAQMSDTQLVIDPKRVKELSELLKAKGLRPLIRKG